MKIHKVRVDVDAIAKGMLAIMEEHLEESYQAAMQLGMLPAPLMNSLEKMLGEQYDKLTKVSYQDAMDAFDGLAGGEEIVADLRESYTRKRKEFVKDTLHEVSLAMYKHYPMVV